MPTPVPKTKREVKLEQLLEKFVAENARLRRDNKLLIKSCDEIAERIKDAKLTKLYDEFMEEVRFGKVYGRDTQFQKTNKFKKRAKK